MDYNKLKKAVDDSDIKVIELCRRAKIEKSTYYQLLKNKSTNVDTLEKLSAALELPMSYWWEDVPVVRDTQSAYPSKNKELLADLKLLQDQLKDKEKIIQLLEKQLAGYEGRSKAAV